MICDIIILSYNDRRKVMEKLEKMGEFFNNRKNEYDEHQTTNVDSENIFYPFTAQCLPTKENAEVLDLGCGTGLELEHYFKINPTAKITGIDLADGMLDILKNKFPDKSLNLIVGSYFDIPFENEKFDCIVSVESLHHFTQAEKTQLYKKVFSALKQGGYFLLTDYFALSDEEESSLRKEYNAIKKEQNLAEDEFYHFDTPLTVEHEIQALKNGGFDNIEIIKTWSCTSVLKATK